MSVTTTSRERELRVATQYAVGVPKTMISTIATAFVSERHDERILCCVRRQCIQQLAGRDAEEDRRDGQQQEEKGDARRENERGPEDPVYEDAFGRARKPAFFSAVCPLPERMPLIHASAAALWADFETTAIS